jgi:K+/H+ antiporter YhaU regulatory subunit KhtT
MKEYGTDLKKQYDTLIRNELSLLLKIKKRRVFLIRNTPKDILASTGLRFEETEDVQAMLDEIIAIEKAYTAQTKQLGLFE